MMVANQIARKLAAFVVALTLVVGGAPMAMAAAGINDCGMAMGATDMQPSMAQDKAGMDMSMSAPAQKHQTPCNDMGGACAATCASAVTLPQAGYSPVLASKPATPGWALLTDFASVFARPDIPPPIAIL